MQKAGQLWIPNNDAYFKRKFERSGNRFDYNHLLAAMRYVPLDRRHMALDVGAHVGSWTVHLAKWFERVWAMEPVKANFSCLTSNTADLKNVLILNMAAGEEAGEVFMLPGSNSGCWHVATSGEETAPMMRLDALAIRRLDFLKIDVEGYELWVLEGMRETLERCKPVVLIEQNGLASRYGVADLETGEYLEDLGMTLAEVVNKDYIYTWEKQNGA